VKNKNISDLIASSMNTVLNSSEHKSLFNSHLKFAQDGNFLEGAFNAQTERATNDLMDAAAAAAAAAEAAAAKAAEAAAEAAKARENDEKQKAAAAAAAAAAKAAAEKAAARARAAKKI
jgi:hypothetical protein